MKRNNYKKYLVFGILTILIGLAFTQIASAYDNNFKVVDTNNDEVYGKLIDVEITSYKPDGSINKKTLFIEESEVNKLKQDLLESDSIEESFLIFKKYNMVSNEDSLKSWENGMRKKAEKLGLTEEKINERFRLRLPILLSFFNSVNAVSILGGSVRIGTTPLANFINAVLSTNLKGIDLFDFAYGFIGVVDTNGLLFDHSLVLIPGLFATIGFVGISVKIPMTVHAFSGYSVLTTALGFGIHVRDFNLIY